MSGECLHALAAGLLLAGCTNDFVVLVPQTGGQPEVDADSVVDAGADEDTSIELPPDLGTDLVNAFSHTCAIFDGALYCWGKNALGQVGNGENAPALRPVRIGQDEFVDVCAGKEHSCALRADGLVLCWGANDQGQLGQGDRQARNRPAPVPMTERVRSIGCGGYSSCAIAGLGDLWCWGDNFEGQLGLDDLGAMSPAHVPDRDMPVQVTPGRRFRQVSLGEGHVCALTERRAVYCWGRNTEGQLGVESTVEQARTPLLIASQQSFARVAAGQNHSCAIESSGKLYCWGARDRVYGPDELPSIVRAPVQIGDDSDYAEIAASWFHSCARKRSGTLVCWGRNDEGQLGLGDFVDHGAPAKVELDSGWRSLALGHMHSCAFRPDGLYCWGANDEGQLGVGNTTQSPTPRAVAKPDG